MELKIGDLVSHKIHKDIIGYGIIISPSVPLYNTIVCSVQWIQTGYIHTMDVGMLEKIQNGHNLSYPDTTPYDTLKEEHK